MIEHRIPQPTCLTYPLSSHFLQHLPVSLPLYTNDLIQLHALPFPLLYSVKARRGKRKEVGTSDGADTGRRARATWGIALAIVCTTKIGAAREKRRKDKLPARRRGAGIVAPGKTDGRARGETARGCIAIFRLGGFIVIGQFVPERSGTMPSVLYIYIYFEN